DPKRGQVTAREVITLFGLTLGSEKRVDYGRVDGAEARRMFIADALAADNLVEPGGAVPAFLARNRALRAELLDWEARLGKGDLSPGGRAVAAFSEARLPADVRDRNGLLTWCRDGANERALTMTAEDVASRDPATLPVNDYPSELEVAGQGVPLS